MDDLWPIAKVRVSTPQITLDHPTSSGLERLARLAGRGVYDPQNRFLANTPVAGWTHGTALESSRAFLQYFWAAQASVKPGRWNLVFAARSGDDYVGVQEIGAQGFAVSGVVSTGSWIARDHQGQGYGRAMREAVLALAFDGLNAERAESAAWIDNAPSVAISKAMGYTDNGVTIREYNGQRHIQQNFVLIKDQWTSLASFEVDVPAAALQMLRD